MQQAGYHHANMLADQFRADLQLQGTEMLTLVQSMANIDNNPPIDEAQPPPQSPPVPVSNTVMQDNVQVGILRFLRDIANQNENNCQRGRDGQEGRDGRGGGTNRNCHTPENVNVARRLTTLYCHTHGGCNHVSADCTSKVPGHKGNTMMENRMGGSSTFCE